ncbi:MAG: hypothetical protein V4580_19335, partial [Bacteroidota bacterium]
STSSNTNSISVIGNATSGPATQTFAVNVSDGCTSPSSTAVFSVTANVCTGLKELDNGAVSFFPNPANNFLILESS